MNSETLELLKQKKELQQRKTVLTKEYYTYFAKNEIRHYMQLAYDLMLERRRLHAKTILSKENSGTSFDMKVYEERIKQLMLEMEEKKKQNSIEAFIKLDEEIEAVKKELETIQQQLMLTCPHIWYGLDEKYPVSKCIICMNKGKSYESENSMFMDKPSMMEAANSTSFHALTQEISKEIEEKGTETDFVRKYRKNMI